MIGQQIRDVMTSLVLNPARVVIHIDLLAKNLIDFPDASTLLLVRLVMRNFPRYQGSLHNHAQPKKVCDR